MAVWLPILGGFQHVKMCASILGPFKAPRGFSSPKSEESHLCQAVPDITPLPFLPRCTNSMVWPPTSCSCSQHRVSIWSICSFPNLWKGLYGELRVLDHATETKKGGSRFRDHKHTQVIPGVSSCFVDWCGWWSWSQFSQFSQFSCPMFYPIWPTCIASTVQPLLFPMVSTPGQCHEQQHPRAWQGGISDLQWFIPPKSWLVKKDGLPDIPELPSGNLT